MKPISPVELYITLEPKLGPEAAKMLIEYIEQRIAHVRAEAKKQETRAAGLENMKQSKTR